MFPNWLGNFKDPQLTIQGNAVANKILHLLTFLAVAISIIKQLLGSLNLKSSQ